VSGHRGWIAPVASLLIAAGCASDDAGAPAAADLHPSQATASTVAEPVGPPPCDPRLLTWSTAAPSEPDTVLVVRVVNTGDVECEVDLSESAIADPTMEPDVWLAPGATGEVVVTEREPGCAEPTIEPTLALTVNAAPVEVVVDPAIAAWCVLSAVAVYSL
jgi:hypothetical protein